MNRIDYSMDEYQANVLRTANKNLDWNQTVENCLLGLIGELGEIVELLNSNNEIFVKFVELAKVAETLKKVKYHGKSIQGKLINDSSFNEAQLDLFMQSNRITTFMPTINNNDELTKELGDTLYYLTWLIDTMGLEASEVAQLNVEKLRKRYAEGFSIEASLNRIA